MNKQKGYSLIELVVMMLVIGVLMTVGAPQLNSFFQSNQMVSNYNEIASTLHIARSEAVKRGSRVTICKSANADAGAPSCATTGDWDQGWIVFVDTDATIGAYNASSDGPLLKVMDGVEGDQVTLTADNASINNYISFTSRGEPKLANGATQSGVLRLCDDRGLTNAGGNVVAVGLVLSASGRARKTKEAGVIVSC